jgi:hypothetical protein
MEHNKIIMAPWFSAQLLEKTEISLLQLVPALMAKPWLIVKAFSHHVGCAALAI